mmetsp:Transcript_42935/g.167847  ORF Transcript_42935/g.167847 Transcript_42935/m.167847 type:complete len:217 (-) Transcript_42935:7-657(-)
MFVPHLNGEDKKSPSLHVQVAALASPNQVCCSTRMSSVHRDGSYSPSLASTEPAFLSTATVSINPIQKKEKEKSEQPRPCQQPTCTIRFPSDGSSKSDETYSDTILTLFASLSTRPTPMLEVNFAAPFTIPLPTPPIVSMYSKSPYQNHLHTPVDILPRQLTPAPTNPISTLRIMKTNPLTIPHKLQHPQNKNKKKSTQTRGLSANWTNPYLHCVK